MLLHLIILLLFSLLMIPSIVCLVQSPSLLQHHMLHVLAKTLQLMPLHPQPATRRATWSMLSRKVSHSMISLFQSLSRATEEGMLFQRRKFLARNRAFQ
uniref:Secreted protein n=1 Tax=Arundo donax TaxID=35708 RepID=A0A0A8XNF5_ARUDO